MYIFKERTLNGNVAETLKYVFQSSVHSKHLWCNIHLTIQQNNKQNNRNIFCCLLFRLLFLFFYLFMWLPISVISIDSTIVSIWIASLTIFNCFFSVLVYEFNLKFDGKLVESLLFSHFLNIVLIYILFIYYTCVCVCQSRSPWYILFNKMNYLLF